MEVTKTKSKYYTLGLAVAFFLIVSISPFLLLSQFKPFYLNRFAAYEIYYDFNLESDKTNYPTQVKKEIIDSEFNTVLTAIRPPFEMPLDRNFFSNEGIKHMYDVVAVFKILWLMYLVAWTVFIWCLAAVANTQNFIRSQYLLGTTKLLKTWVLCLFFIAVFSFVNWQTTFELFHKLIFPYNNYWQLNPETSNLIKYFDNMIFAEMFALYVISQLTILLVLLKINHYKDVEATTEIPEDR